MTGRQLITDAQNTWCPGCGNFSIQHTLKNLLADMEKEGKDLDTVVLVTGIGCHAKMADYINVNSFYSIHGRAIPVATGIKLANPDLTVICCVGDGDAYAEGLDHLLFAAKRNIDITVLVHNNRVYGLTTGQYTPTSPLGFKGKSTPAGTLEFPMNPLDLLLASGATYVARGYTRKMEQLKTLVRDGVLHRGFSFIDILQICATFFPMTDYYNKRTYDLPEYDRSVFDLACSRAREWDYNGDAPIALGVFYQREGPTLDKKVDRVIRSVQERDNAILDFLASRQ
ncbi:MAG: 2-oxoglutarate synthase subunit KorB [Methanoregula sp. PtaU1.Bin051]|nr:MAG: 2-oxoglutarate synthase subunit KorB [Methanoregula sp. PtaU1.Bin051]